MAASAPVVLQSTATTAATPTRLTPGLIPAPAVPSPIGPAAPAGTAVLSPRLILNDAEGLSATLALRQKFAKTDPKYAASFGAEAFERSSKSGLKLTGWRVTDVVQRIWGKLEGSLASLVLEKRHEWEDARPQCQPGQKLSGSHIPLYLLRCFLLGPDKEHATPHVAILCNTGWFRKAVGKIFTKSALLVPDGFKCFGLPDKAELYVASGLMSFADPAQPRHLSPLGDFKVKVPEDYRTVNGLEIEILLDDVVVGKSTVGGVVKVVNHRLGMTTRHAFTDPSVAAEFARESDRGSSDCEIDLFDDDDDDGLVEPSSETDLTSEGDSTTSSQNPIKANPRENPRRRDQNFEIYPSSSDLVLGGLDTTQLERYALGASEPGLDWVLKQFQPTDKNRYFITPQRVASEDRIVVKTPSRILYGDMGSSGIFGVPISTKPQPVIVATVAGVQPGDSGSWAMKLKDGAFTGMLVGSCPTLKEVYFIRLPDVLDDIRLQIGIKPSVPTLSTSNPISNATLDNSYTPKIGLPFSGALFYSDCNRSLHNLWYSKMQEPIPSMAGPGPRFEQGRARRIDDVLGRANRLLGMPTDAEASETAADTSENTEEAPITASDLQSAGNPSENEPSVLEDGRAWGEMRALGSNDESTSGWPVFGSEDVEFGQVEDVEL